MTDAARPLNLPRFLFLTKGVGKHKEKLSSFEVALRNAGIEKFNLVRVSSIFPPGCKIITRAKGLGLMHPGQITFCVLADNSSNEPNRLIASSIGIALPAHEEHYGYLSEHHSFGQTEKVAGDYAEDLAAQMLSSTYGIEFDIDDSYDSKKEIFKIDGRIVRTSNITQSAVGDKNGLWTTTVAAAVFVL
ncbi:MAG: arginine decarboxylase, pyruvoyl-dependent [Euryarchaeota archaeon]|nr:arginine decarboxylase, pyruvoyl-dependent [Euryarchaeota archaeon]